MIRPVTCLCLMMAAGSGLYLYQVKQRAFALDADLRSTFHDIDAARDRTRMLKADWALMNDPERLQTLATQYLTLKPMGPSQLLTMDQLASALPPPGAPPSAAAPETDPAKPSLDPHQGIPMAAAGPQVLPHTSPLPEVASLEPPVPAAEPAAPLPPVAAQTVTAPVLPPASAPTKTAAAAPVVPHPVRPAVKRWTHAAAPAATPPQSRSWLASAGADVAPPARLAEAVATPRPAAHKTHHRIAPANGPVQLYASNDANASAQPTRMAAVPRITPQAATVMYSPPSGSSLGGAAATLAPPRPLYSSSQ
jgi:hypothetical protein